MVVPLVATGVSDAPAAVRGWLAVRRGPPWASRWSIPLGRVRWPEASGVPGVTACRTRSEEPSGALAHASPNAEWRDGSPRAGRLSETDPGSQARWRSTAHPCWSQRGPSWLPPADVMAALLRRLRPPSVVGEGAPRRSRGLPRRRRLPVGDQGRRPLRSCTRPIAAWSGSGCAPRLPGHRGAHFARPLGPPAVPGRGAADGPGVESRSASSAIPAFGPLVMVAAGGVTTEVLGRPRLLWPRCPPGRRPRPAVAPPRAAAGGLPGARPSTGPGASRRRARSATWRPRSRSWRRPTSVRCSPVPEGVTLVDVTMRLAVTALADAGVPRQLRQVRFDPPPKTADDR